jgi:hypothetical protein
LENCESFEFRTKNRVGKEETEKEAGDRKFKIEGEMAAQDM